MFLIMKLNSKNGFTIVELIVSMSLFVILFSITTGVFVQSLRTQRATVALIAANSNASLAIEQMAREMRTGKNFSQTSQQEIDFTNAKGEAVIYKLDSSFPVIEKSADGGITFKKITADNVLVKNLNFLLFTGSPADPYPPRITIIIQAGTNALQVSGVSINLQTTVSARVLK